VAHGVWVNASLLHVERARVPLVLRELHRVLRPPALLHLSLKRGDGEGFDTDRYGAEHPRWFTYWQADALDAALAAAGFHVREAETRAGSRDTWLVRLASAEA